MEAQDAFEKERKERVEQEMATKRGKQTNIRKARNEFKEAKLEEYKRESDSRRELEEKAKKEREQLDEDARLANEKYLRWKLQKAKREAEQREEKAKKWVEEKRAMELYLEQEECQDRCALGVAMGDGGDGWDSDASTSSQEPRDGWYDSPNESQGRGEDDGQVEGQTKEFVSEVVWSHTPGSNCMREVEYVGKRKIEVIRPQLANKKPAGAGRG